MNTSTITTSTFTVATGGNNISGAVTYSGITATFTPASALAYNTQYTAIITTEVKDSAGNVMANNYTWSFTTGSNSIADTTIITNSIGMKLVYIQPGTFQMGSPTSEAERWSNETQHKVTLTNGFYLQTTEVTQEQWKAVMGNDNNPSYFKGDNLPVEQVSWNDCQEFIVKLNTLTGKNYRLPTEAEWEYACRAGTTTAFHYGNSLSSDMANFNGNYPYNAAVGVYRGKTTDVGSFELNAFGLYDMHGNVYEWCSDWYGTYASGDQTNPVGANTGSFRVIRGGSWDYYARSCRSAFRGCNESSSRSSSIGFRLASPASQ